MQEKQLSTDFIFYGPLTFLDSQEGFDSTFDKNPTMNNAVPTKISSGDAAKELLKAFANSCKFDVFLNACRLDYVSSEWVEGSKKAMGEVFKKINSMKQIWMDKVRVLHHDTPDVLYSKYIVRCSLLSQTTRRSGRRLNRVQRIIMGCHRN